MTQICFENIQSKNKLNLSYYFCKARTTLKFLEYCVSHTFYVVESIWNICVPFLINIISYAVVHNIKKSFSNLYGLYKYIRIIFNYFLKLNMYVPIYYYCIYKQCNNKWHWSKFLSFLQFNSIKQFQK